MFRKVMEVLTNRWDGGYNFSQLQFVENSCFTSGIQTN